MNSRTWGLLVSGFVFVVLASGALLVGCSYDDEKEDGEVGNAPDSSTAEMQPDEATVSDVVRRVVVRVSGTPGTVYSGAYGTIEEGQSVDAVVEAEPTDYEVKAEGGVLDAVAAAFRKTQSEDEGMLRAEILIDDEVVDEEETSAEFGVVNVSWSPQTGPMERVVPSH